MSEGFFLPRWRVGLTAWAVSLLAGLVMVGCQRLDSGGATGSGVRPDSYLFCFWNTENLFDDQNDHRTGADEAYDRWFADNAQDRQLKYDHLSQALVQLNDGRGPDILVVAEVESVRAAELLQDALNKKLPPAAPPYDHVLMKEVHGGRHIATALLTRLPVQGNRTQLLGRALRIMEAHVNVDGHDLVVLATHWTSRVTDKKGDHRCKYAQQAYGRFLGMYKGNPKVDLLVCGDFNDTPEDRSVTECLHATGDLNTLKQSADGDRPMLLDLMAPPLFRPEGPVTGTISHNGRWAIFDQIVVSPGLLDRQGWSVEPESTRIVSAGLVKRRGKKEQPWRFGNQRDQNPRGYSDHLPVTVRLRVQGGGE